MGRFQFVLLRLALMVPLLLAVVLLVFLILQATPGDPVRLIVGLRATEEQLDQVRADLGLNDPFLLQYVRYVGDIATGDLGYSYKSGVPVTTLIGQSLPITAWLMGLGILFSLLISIPAAFAAALRPNRLTDHLVRGGGLLGLAMPPFWVGTMLILAVALPTGFFPVAGFGLTTADHLRSMVLPALTLAVAMAPLQIRSLRASILSVLDSDYVTTARSLGIRPGRVLRKFVLRNAAVPTVTMLALNVGFMLFGAVVIEVAFALPGIGQSLVLAVGQRDIPAIQGFTLLFAVLVIGLYLLADIVIAALDPRTAVS